MFLKAEGERIVNVELIDMVEFKHSKKQATLWSAGVPVLSDSELAYVYFADNEDILVKEK